MKLLAVSGNDQERVVGTRPQHHDRHDRAGLPVDRHPELGEAIAEGASEELREDHRRQRDEQEDRRAVDQDQEDDHERDRGQQQRAVDALEDLDGVRAIAGAARDLDLEPAAGIRDGVAPEIDGVENRVALAVALQVGRHDRGLAVLRADRADEWRVVVRLAGDLRRRAAAARGQAALLPGLRRRLAALGRRTLGGTARLAAGRRRRAVRDHAREALRRHLRDVLPDLGEVRRGQPGVALVDDDRRRELAALKVLRGGERVRRLGVTR